MLIFGQTSADMFLVFFYRKSCRDVSLINKLVKFRHDNTKRPMGAAGH